MSPGSRPLLVLRRNYLFPSCQWQCLRNRAPIAMALPFPRYASNRSSKPKVLEKPTRFNPPSHPSRLVKQQMPRHYGPQMTEQRVLEFDRTEFPHMLPPRGTWKHWFLTSRLFHTWFALVSATSAQLRQNSRLTCTVVGLDGSRRFCLL